MNRKNTDAIQAATLKSFAAQIERTLAVARIQGWDFPAKFAIGVTVVAATAIATKVKVRMDGAVREATISSTNIVKDIAQVSDDIVYEWLDANATAKPARKRRAND